MDCGYANAVELLLGVGNSMEQNTPPAMMVPGTPVMMVPRTPVMRRFSEKDASETEDEDDKPSKKRQREDSSAEDDDDETSPSGESSAEDASSSSEPLPKRARRTHKTPIKEVSIWEKIGEREESASYRVVPNYPDTRWWLNQLPPGSRRKAVNIIYLMANKLNLEVGTPSMAVLLFDRFLSAVKVPVPSHKILLIAAVCLNIAGKIVDIDRGFCGSKPVMQMIRDMVPQNVRQKSERVFSIMMGDMECYILQCMNNEMIELPPAIQCISEITNWDARNCTAWLHASLICDIFNTDTASTNFRQCDIARVVIEDICGIPSEKSDLFTAIQKAKAIFVASGEELAFSDPYFGVRMRHSLNECVSLLLESPKS